MNYTVGNGVVGGGECLPVATAQIDATRSEIVERTVFNAVVTSGLTVEVGVIINVLIQTAELAADGPAGEVLAVEWIRFDALPDANPQYPKVVKDAS